MRRAGIGVTHVGGSVTLLLMALHSKREAWCARSTDEMTSVFCSTSSYVDGSTFRGSEDWESCHLGKIIAPQESLFISKLMGCI